MSPLQQTSVQLFGWDFFCPLLTANRQNLLGLGINLAYGLALSSKDWRLKKQTKVYSRSLIEKKIRLKKKNLPAFSLNI